MELRDPSGRRAIGRTVHGHLVDLGGVILLDVAQDTDVVVLHKVDGHALTAVTSGPTDPGGGQRVTLKTPALCCWD